MRSFDYYRPTDFDEAFKLLTLPDKAVTPLAGATDLIPMIRDEQCHPDIVVDIKGLPGLCDLKTVTIGPCCGISSGDCLQVGAAVRMNEISNSVIVHSHWDILAQGAAAMGNEQVRNRATLGGNLCTSSPAADTAPALLTLEACALLNGPIGKRSIPIADFFQGPRQNVLKPGELLTGVLIPQPPAGTVGHYEKLSRRKAGDLAIVGAAVLAIPHDDGYHWRIALGAVAPTPIRAPEAEEILNTATDADSVDKAAEAAYGCCSPIDDIRSSAEYRHAMTITITKRAIQAVLDKF